MEGVEMAVNKDHNLTQRDGVWYFRKVINGKDFRSALSQSVTEARRIRNEYLLDLKLHGTISALVQSNQSEQSDKLFGEMATEWVSIISKDIKKSTLSDYRYSMNRYILPHFGDMPIKAINYLDIRKFISTLICSRKRVNNIMVPMRSVFKMAYLSEIIDKNPMDRVKNVKTDKPDIYPLSMEEVRLFFDSVSPRFKNFFIVAFFSGMRFGEMACLKWRNVDFRLGVIKVRETRVMGEEGRPKTKKSTRDIKILPPVLEALKDQKKETAEKSGYVFLNQYGKNIDPMSMNFHVWKPGLKKAGLAPRSLYQTRHTFATLMLDAGEHPGWVQKKMGHETMQMIYEKYYSYIKNYDRDEGSAFMEKVFTPQPEEQIEELKAALI
jgi:integrase